MIDVQRTESYSTSTTSQEAKDTLCCSSFGRRNLGPLEEVAVEKQHGSTYLPSGLRKVSQNSSESQFHGLKGYNDSRPSIGDGTSERRMLIFLYYS